MKKMIANLRGTCYRENDRFGYKVWIEHENSEMLLRRTEPIYETHEIAAYHMTDMVNACLDYLKEKSPGMLVLDRNT